MTIWHDWDRWDSSTLQPMWTRWLCPGDLLTCLPCENFSNRIILKWLPVMYESVVESSFCLVERNRIGKRMSTAKKEEFVLTYFLPHSSWSTVLSRNGMFWQLKELFVSQPISWEVSWKFSAGDLSLKSSCSKAIILIDISGSSAA